eukprot:COSAG03_NODE_22784_length_286_cov_7828.957219_1_plen_27_part_10
MDLAGDRAEGSEGRPGARSGGYKLYFY